MFRFVTTAFFAIMLVSCASSGVRVAERSQTSVTVRDTVRIVDTLKIIDSVFLKQTESFKDLQKSIDSLIARGQTEKAIDLLKRQVQFHNNLDQLGFRTLQLANLFYQTGHGAEALAILESFAVYKPAINLWIDSANTLYDKITRVNRVEVKLQIDSAKLEAINSLTAQIRNLKNVNADPAFIMDLADSLRSIAPGDSVLAWLEKQIPSATENSDSFCEEQRKFAAEHFASSRKNKAKASTFLNEAIEALDKCLARTPSVEMRRKVTQNREILEKEKQTLGGG
jgi:tetratricopeptide (TPR) repeat protein